MAAFDAAHRDAHSELALTVIRAGNITSTVIDRTFVAADGIRWLVDFKTSPHEGGDLVMLALSDHGTVSASGRMPLVGTPCERVHADRSPCAFADAAAMQKDLQQWILQYVDGDPANSSEATKAQRPLAAAEIVVEEVAGNPGYYTSKFFLRPHYQLEGLSVSLRLTSKLPSAKAA